MSLIVQKYGGSSLETTACIRGVAEKIYQRKKSGCDLVVVVSAMGKTTDQLYALAQEITPVPPSRELDMLLSSGERVSMSLLSMALHHLGDPAISFTGSQSGIVTDSEHTKAKILNIKSDRIREALSQKKTVIVAGFQGVSVDREVTTLGRGGSDVTAVALAIALQADRCEFYKDVDGVYTQDPKRYPEAKKLTACTYSDVASLIDQGATVLHPEAVHLAKKFSMPIYVASTFQEERGTLIQQV